MRYLLALTCAALISSAGAYAQRFPDFGMPTLAEFQMQKCDFEPDAEAAMLLHEAKSDYDQDHRLVTDHHYRIKILKEKGIEYATIKIPFRAGYDVEAIVDVEAFVISKEPNGEIVRVPVDKKSIYTEKTNQYWNHVKFTFPSVRVGSILEYKYRSIFLYLDLRDWQFQEEMPVLHSRYDVTVDPNTEFSYIVQQSPPYEARVQKQAREGSIRFEMDNIRSLPNEAYMDARGDNLQRVEFQLSGLMDGRGYRKIMTSWNEVIKELSGNLNFGTQLNKNLSGTDPLIQQWKSISNEEQRIHDVYEFVRKNMNWNFINSIGSRDGVKDAWTKKSGTSGDINLILVNLLQSAGLDANPLLVAERHTRHVNPNLPFVDQFNTVMAIVTVGEKSFIIDATRKHLRYSMMPPSILNTIALVVKRKGTLINISDPSTFYKQLTSVSAKLDANGQISGDTYLSFSDYARGERLESYQTDAERYVEGFKQYMSITKIQNFEHQNDEKDSLPFINKFSFSAPTNASGDYTFVSLNFFTGLTTNPFIAETRTSNINFGWKTNFSNTIMLEIDDSYKADELPKSIQVTNNDKSLAFTREVIKDETGKKFMVRIKFVKNSSFFPAEDYSDLRQFYKKVFELLNEPLILKKV